MRYALYICLGAVAILAISLPALLSARKMPVASPAPERIASEEHQKTIEALKPPKRKRPAIALIAANDGTEVADFLTAYGVLKDQRRGCDGGGGSDPIRSGFTPAASRLRRRQPPRSLTRLILRVRTMSCYLLCCIRTMPL